MQVKNQSRFSGTKVKSYCSGFGLIEIVVGASILAVALVGIVASMRLSLRTAHENLSGVQANFLLMEGMEALRALRDASWTANISSLTASSTYYFYWDGVNWTATSTPQIVDGKFYRDLVLHDVYRDGSDNIAGSGTLDSGTKKAVASVAWRAGKSTTTLQTTTYISNIFSN